VVCFLVGICTVFFDVAYQSVRDRSVGYCERSRFAVPVLPRQPNPVGTAE
jgi:hypothetical protein